MRSQAPNTMASIGWLKAAVKKLDNAALERLHDVDFNTLVKLAWSLLDSKVPEVAAFARGRLHSNDDDLLYTGWLVAFTVLYAAQGGPDDATEFVTWMKTGLLSYEMSQLGV